MPKGTGYGGKGGGGKKPAITPHTPKGPARQNPDGSFMRLDKHGMPIPPAGTPKRKGKR